MKVYTAQFRYGGADRLDITVKSGIKSFAPTWQIVMDYKNKKITEEEYTRSYIDMLYNSVHLNYKDWIDLLDRDEVTLVCYCPPNNFCHRIILAKFLEENIFGVKYMGERL